jgi:hypothetical protein
MQRAKGATRRLAPTRGANSAAEVSGRKKLPARDTVLRLLRRAAADRA